MEGPVVEELELRQVDGPWLQALVPRVFPDNCDQLSADIRPVERPPRTISIRVPSLQNRSNC
jgi:hypothetical protein